MFRTVLDWYQTDGKVKDKDYLKKVGVTEERKEPW